MFTMPQAVTRAGFGQVATSFHNPIAKGADPWVVRHNGCYYWCVSDRDLGVAVFRSHTLGEQGQKFLVWSAAKRGPYSSQVWAPELHWLDGRWYIYVAVSDGNNANHRMIVLESRGCDPTEPFHFKSELYTGDDFTGRTNNRWAIDATILEHGGKRYCLWSGWEDERDEQWLYIATMANPWTINSARVRLCPNNDYVWERVSGTKRGRGLNEGPQVLQRNGRVFVVYSCSGSWEPSYKLGMLELKAGGHPMHAGSWKKHAHPVFKSTHETWGVGHCSFTQSLDGTEDWIVYHAKVSRNHGWDRVIHAQRFTWDETGLPVFGDPMGARMAMKRPGGELVPDHATAWLRARDLIASVNVRNVRDEASDERLKAS